MPSLMQASITFFINEPMTLDSLNNPHHSIQYPLKREEPLQFHFETSSCTALYYKILATGYATQNSSHAARAVVLFIHHFYSVNLQFTV